METIAILGTGPGAGKTTVSTALITALRQHKSSVLPIKAISVGQKQQQFAEAPFETDAAFFLRTSAGLPKSFQASPNQIFIENPTALDGQLFFSGRCVSDVTLKAADTFCLSSISPSLRRTMIERARTTLIEYITKPADFIVIEGAGAVTTLPTSQDLANFMLPQWAKATVFLVVSLKQTQWRQDTKRSLACLRKAGLNPYGIIGNKISNMEEEQALCNFAEVNRTQLLASLQLNPAIGNVHFDGNQSLNKLWQYRADELVESLKVNKSSLDRLVQAHQKF